MEGSAPQANVTGSGIANPELPLKKKPLTRSKHIDEDCFEVDNTVFYDCVRGKNRYERWDKFIDHDVAFEIKEFARENPKKRILLKNSDSGALVYLR